jgi:hypothetical protein
MDDLTGTADDRARQLRALAADGPLEAAWLHRQLDLALGTWGEAESELRIAAERREDY